MRKIVFLCSLFIIFLISSLFFYVGQTLAIDIPVFATDCACESPNIAGVAKNGFNCNLGGRTRHGWCRGNDACIDANPNTEYSNYVSGGGVWELPKNSSNIRTLGITCAPPKTPLAYCHCRFPANVAGTGKNGFDCTYNGRTLGGYCNDKIFACLDDSNAVYAFPHGSGANEITPGSTYAVGVRCKIPTATSCRCDANQETAANKNGFMCSYNTFQLHGWCKGTDSICFQGTAANTYYSVVTNGGTWELPNGVAAQGIRCAKPDGTAGRVELPVAAPPCATSLNTDGSCPEVTTSFGNFSTNPGEFIVRVFGILLAASGAIALLLIMRAGYKIMTSRGNPEGVKEGREQIVAAVVGLMFLIFSMVFLQVIANDLLRIPGSSPTGATSTGGTTTACEVSLGGDCVASPTCRSPRTILGKMDCGGSSEIICCR